MKNRHLLEFLRYYCTTTAPPGYAVLIDGPWGSGKTYVVKNFLETQTQNERKPLYVSLYGLTSLDDVEQELFVQLHPIAGSKGVKLAGRALKGFLRSGLKIDLDWKPTDYGVAFGSHLLVFDDLERCGMPLQEILGYINAFVEHEGSRVLIIANESELPKKELDEYARRKEKLIGKTLAFEPNLDDALDAFVSSMSNAVSQAFARAHRNQIVQVYEKAALFNLRILRQAIWDVDRFYAALPEAARRDRDISVRILKIVLILAFELRAGRLKPADLETRPSVTGLAFGLGLDGAEASHPFVATCMRYGDVRLDELILPAPIYVDLVMKGVLEIDRLAAAIDDYRSLGNQASNLHWRPAWDIMDKNDDEAATLIATLRTQLKDGNVRAADGLLHSFGILLLAADAGVITLSRSQVVDEAKLLIERLGMDGRLERLLEVAIEKHYLAGLAIHKAETNEFADIAGALRKWREKAELDRTKKESSALCNLMRSDPAEFYDRCVRGAPINLTDPQLFGTIFLSLAPVDQRVIFNGIAERISAVAKEPPIINWITSLANALEVEARQGTLSVYRVAAMVRQLREIASQSEGQDPSPRLT